MARRLVGREPSAEKVTVSVDPISEAAVIVSAVRACMDGDPRLLDELGRRLPPEKFLGRESREAWEAVLQARRQGLDLEDSVLRAIAGASVAAYLSTLLSSAQPSKNVEWHVANMLWDHARAAAARGPIPELIEALKDGSDREKVLSLSRRLTAVVDDEGDRRYICDPTDLAREAMRQFERAAAGTDEYSSGIPGLDDYRPGERRLIPGLAPGQMTCLTASSGAGKSTMAARMALGIAFPGGVGSDQPGRRVGYGAWEMHSPMTLRIMACMALEWSRRDLLYPKGAPKDSPFRTHQGKVLLEERMHRIGKRIMFMRSPFQRRVGEKPSNERNLDVLQGLISDMGVEVFFADLWKRLLAGDRGRTPDAEEAALERQQAMNEELGIHLVALQQQRVGDVEKRADPRPTREGIKGSKTWVEVPDLIVAPHRPHLYRRVPDDKMQVIVLKQRFAPWPLAAEFDWDADRGAIEGGVPIEYERPGEQSDLDAAVDPFLRRRRR